MFERFTTDILFIGAATLLLLVSFGCAPTVPDPDCGPQFNPLNADNVIPRYRQVLASHKTLVAFHHSIPARYTIFDPPPEAVARLQDCYRRAEGLLTPRAEAGDVEAQFVLGHFLLAAYSPLDGGHLTFGEHELNVRQRGHQWLVKAEEAEHPDAVEKLVRYHIQQLGFSVEMHRGGVLSDDPPIPGLPDPKDMLEWIVQAGARGHPIAYSYLQSHFRTRIAWAIIAKDQALIERYQGLADHYLRLWVEARPRNPTERSGAND